MTGREARLWIADHAEDYPRGLGDGKPVLWVGGPGDPERPLPGARSFFGRLRFARAFLWLLRRPTPVTEQSEEHSHFGGGRPPERHSHPEWWKEHP